MGATFLAVGLFASSLTENQIVAAIVTFGVLLMFWVLGWSGGRSPAGRSARVLTHLSILEHNDSFAKGVLDTKDIIYYVNFTCHRPVPHAALARGAPVGGLMRRSGLGLLSRDRPAGRGGDPALRAAGLAIASVVAAGDRRPRAGGGLARPPGRLGARSALGGRTVRYGFNTAVMVLLVLGIIGVVEALSYRHNARLDLTENRRHSLSPQTIQLLGGFKTEVNAVAFYRGDQPGKRVAEDLFKQYARYAGDKFTWKSVDPDREPALARRYGVEAYGTIVLETKGAAGEGAGRRPEEKLTNGLVKVTREGKRVVYVTQGHGEPEITNTERTGFSEAKGALEQGQLRGQAAVAGPAGQGAGRRARSSSSPAPGTISSRRRSTRSTRTSAAAASCWSWSTRRSRRRARRSP